MLDEQENQYFVFLLVFCEGFRTHAYNNSSVILGHLQRDRKQQEGKES